MPPNRPRTYPDAGAFRVHREPSTLVRRVRPLHRFDDPDSEFGVWYLATRLRGAMIEVLDHWRRDAAAEEDIAAVTGVEGFDVVAEIDGGPEFAGSVPASFLDELKLVKGYLRPDPGPAFVNMRDERYLAELNLRPRIRAALRAGGSDAFGTPPTLGPGAVQDASPPARRLTQAVSREVFVEAETFSGIRYISRHTDNEEAWAVFDHETRPSQLDFTEPELLDPLDRNHRTAVQQAAALLRLQLPAPWAAISR